MKSIFSIVAVVLVMALMASATGQECTPTTSNPELAARGFYVDNDFCQFDDDDDDHYGGGGPCLFSIWTYQESNDIDGLQRWDQMVDDTCNGLIQPDSLAFY